MRRFICVVFVILLFLNGCQIPVDTVIDDDQEFDYIRTEGEIRTEDEILDTYVSQYSESEAIDRAFEEEDEKQEKVVQKEENEYITITAYYRDSDDMIVPVTRKIKRQEGIARAVIESMIKNEANTNVLQPYKLFSVLPEGTVVLGMNIKEGTVFVDFNKRFLEYNSKTQEINIISSVVYSLTEFDNVDNVKILIDGREKDRLEFGTDISGYLNRENILINSKKLNIEERVKKIDIYLYKNANEQFDYLLPVSFEYIGIEKRKIPNEIIRLLGKSYDDQKVFSQLPPGANLIDSKLDGDTLILNFNNELRNYGGTAREEGILNQIFHSMKQIEGVEKVKILIEGKEGELPEGTDISKDISIQNKINIV